MANDCQSDFLITAKFLNKISSLLGHIITSFMKLSITGHCIAGVVGQAFHFHISEATCNLMDRVGMYYCEEMGLTQIKILLLTGVFYVAIYGIRCPVCSFFPQDFVNPIHLLQGRLLSNVTP